MVLERDQKIVFSTADILGVYLIESQLCPADAIFKCINCGFDVIAGPVKFCPR